MIERFTITPSFAMQAGDTFVLNGRRYEQWRGTTLVSFRDLNQMASAPVTGPEHFGGNQIQTLYLERVMPGQNVSCTKVQENQISGAVSFSFSDGEITEFADWEAVGQEADSVDASTALGRKILVCKTYRNSPDGANKTNQVGAMVSLNGLADTPVDYTPPQ